MGNRTVLEPTGELLITIGSHAFLMSALIMAQEKAEDGNRDLDVSRISVYSLNGHSKRTTRGLPVGVSGNLPQPTHVRPEP